MSKRNNKSKRESINRSPTLKNAKRKGLKETDIKTILF